MAKWRAMKLRIWIQQTVATLALACGLFVGTGSTEVSAAENFLLRTDSSGGAAWYTVNTTTNQMTRRGVVSRGDWKFDRIVDTGRGVLLAITPAGELAQIKYRIEGKELVFDKPENLEHRGWEQFEHLVLGNRGLYSVNKATGDLRLWTCTLYGDGNAKAKVYSGPVARGWGSCKHILPTSRGLVQCYNGQLIPFTLKEDLTKYRWVAEKDGTGPLNNRDWGVYEHLVAGEQGSLFAIQRKAQGSPEHAVYHFPHAEATPQLVDTWWSPVQCFVSLRPVSKSKKGADGKPKQQHPLLVLTGNGLDAEGNPANEKHLVGELPFTQTTYIGEFGFPVKNDVEFRHPNCRISYSGTWKRIAKDEATTEAKEGLNYTQSLGVTKEVATELSAGLSISTEASAKFLGSGGAVTVEASVGFVLSNSRATSTEKSIERTLEMVRGKGYEIWERRTVMEVEFDLDEATENIVSPWVMSADRDIAAATWYHNVIRAGYYEDRLIARYGPSPFDWDKNSPDYKAYKLSKEMTRDKFWKDICKEDNNELRKNMRQLRSRNRKVRYVLPFPDVKKVEYDL